jgi:hypothetical protein
VLDHAATPVNSTMGATESQETNCRSGCGDRVTSSITRPTQSQGKMASAWPATFLRSQSGRIPLKSSTPRVLWKKNDTHRCCAFQTITGAKMQSATASARYGPGCASQWRCSRRVST